MKITAIAAVLLASTAHSQTRTGEPVGHPGKKWGRVDAFGHCVPMGALCKNAELVDLPTVEEPAPEPDTSPVPAVYRHKPTITTCADKSRFLMTAEDGSKHCIKLN